MHIERIGHARERALKMATPKDGKLEDGQQWLVPVLFICSSGSGCRFCV